MSRHAALKACGVPRSTLNEKGKVREEMRREKSRETGNEKWKEGNQKD